eukprot:6174286-Pleurochrysis_carterae.AAC.1
MPGLLMVITFVFRSVSQQTATEVAGADDCFVHIVYGYVVQDRCGPQGSAFSLAEHVMYKMHSVSFQSHASGLVS